MASSLEAALSWFKVMGMGMGTGVGPPTKTTSQYISVQVEPTKGVYEVRNLNDFNAPVIVDEDEFYRGLKKMRTEMAAIITNEMAMLIDFRYGIKWLKHTRKGEILPRYEQK